MKIAIVSDTHDNMANFKSAIEWIKKEKINLILHCGDIFTQETIGKAEKFSGKGNEIKFIKGNADHGLNLPDKLELKIKDKKIALSHLPNEAKKLAQSKKFDLVFYGHTHRPWDEKIGECHMINPGEMAGHFYKPTFAVYNTDTKKLELKVLERLD